MQLTLQELLKFVALLHAPKKSMSLRASPQTGVAIPFDFRQHPANLMGVATPLRPQARFERNRRKAAALSARCGALVRDDSLFITVR